MARAGGKTGGGWRGLLIVRHVMPLLAMLLAQVALAGQAWATDWVVNFSDTGTAPVPAGKPFYFDIDVTNDDLPAATAPATTITLAIEKDAKFVDGVGGSLGGSLAITNCQVEPTIGPGTVTCDVPALAGKQRASLRVQMIGEKPGTLTLLAEVPKAGDSRPENNTQKKSRTIIESADIELTVSTSPSNPRPGGDLSFTFTATNLPGNDLAATGIRVSIPPPVGLTDIRAPANCASPTPTVPNYICTIAGPLQPGQSANLTFTSVVDRLAGSDITIAGTRTASEPPDPNDSNDTASTTIVVDPGTTLKLTKVRSPNTSTIFVGDTVTFTLRPSFIGDMPVNLVVTDTVPANFEIIDPQPAGIDWDCLKSTSSTAICERSDGGSSGSVTLPEIEINAKVKSAGGNVRNTATFAADNTNVATAQDTLVTINERTADLAAVKTASATAVNLNTPFNFSIGARNLGNSPYSGKDPANDNLVMTDQLPEGMSVWGITPNGWTCTTTPDIGPVTQANPLIGPATIGCTRTYTTLAPLSVGATTPLVVLRTVMTKAETIGNALSVGSVVGTPTYPDPDEFLPETNNKITFNVGGNTAGTEADIGVFKSASPPSLRSGELETFTIEVVNNGPGVSTGVVLTDDLTQLINNSADPANGNATNTGVGSILAAAGSATGLSCSSAALGGLPPARRLTCNIASLPVCTRGVDCPVITVAVRPGGDGLGRVNTAGVKSLYVFDNVPANDTSSASYDVLPRTALNVAKAATPLVPVAGQPLTYVITASVPNDGRSVARGTNITDTLPDGLFFVSAVAVGGTCGTQPTPTPVTGPGNNILKCSLGDLLPNQQRTVTVTVRPSTATRGQPLTNTVTAAMDPAIENANPNPTASITVTPANPALDLQINKFDDPDPIAVTERTEFTINVTNNGRSAAEDVVVTDTLPSAILTYISHSVPPDGSCSVVPAARSLGGKLVCSFPVLAAGQLRTIKVLMEGAAKGVAENAVAVTSRETKLGFEANTTNNSDTETTTVSNRVDLEVTRKKPSTPTVTLNEDFTYQIDIQNKLGANLGEADDVTLLDAVPAGMVVTAEPTAQIVTGTTTLNACNRLSGNTSFKCSFGTMSRGARIAVTLPVRITSQPGGETSFPNTATVATSSKDIDLTNNSKAGVVSITTTSLAGRVFKDFNDDGIENGDDVGVANVVLVLRDAGGATVQATTAGDGSYLFDSVPPGSYALTRGDSPQPELQDGRAIPGTLGGSAQGSRVITGIVIQSGDRGVAYDFTLIPVTGIGLSKAVESGPSTNPDGSFDVSYRMVVSNPNGEALSGVTVTDVLQGAGPRFGTFAPALPAPGTYAIVAAPSGTCGGLNADFNGASEPAVARDFVLASGDSCSLEFSLRVRPSDPPPQLVSGVRYVNVASVTGAGNQSGKEVSSQATTGIAPDIPDVSRLTIDKSLAGHDDKDGGATVTLDDILTFKVAATNAGSTTLTNVVVSDNRITPSSNTCPVLQPGEICVLTGTYAVTLADVQAGSVVNTATADSNETDPVTATLTTPVVATVDENTLTKTALVSTAKRGEKVPYVIVAQKVPFNPARIVDVMPPAFSFVPGSAVANGKKVEPAVDGRNLTFDGLVPDEKGGIKLELTLVATASVNPGVAVNQAQLVNPKTGDVVATAKARVTILAEAVFDCGDIIGKVFDDKNRNGYQDEGEPGLPAVRVATVGGLLVTTDAQGRFNIPCADIPDADIGSNFILKLDVRTLPSGYRVTTENPRRVRLTRGKVVKLNFGASISRIVKLELNGKVFEQGSDALLPRWQAGLDRLVTALEAENSVLEITYRGSDGALAKARLRAVKKEIARRWQAVPDHYDLAIDTRIVSGAAP